MKFSACTVAVLGGLALGGAAVAAADAAASTPSGGLRSSSSAGAGNGDGNGETADLADRALQMTHAHMDFAPLMCNKMPIDVDADECLAGATPLSSLVDMASTMASMSGGGDHSSSCVTVPCGTCAYVDYADGSTVTLPGGLNVVGRLHFPPTSNVVLNTTHVFVQGVLGMDPPAEGNQVKITFRGTEEQTLYPHEHCCSGTPMDHGDGGMMDHGNGTMDGGMDGMMRHRHLLCDMECMHKKNVGKKPFVVAGGRLDIAAGPTCPSWTHLSDVLTTDPPAPPAECAGDTDLTQGDGTFESGASTGFFSHGAGTMTVQSETVDGAVNHYLHQTGRTSDWSGIGVKLKPQCVAAGRTYNMRLKYKITATDGNSTVPADDFIGMISWKRPPTEEKPNDWGHQHMIFCSNLVAAPGEWSSFCEGSVDFNDDKASAVEMQVTIVSNMVNPNPAADPPVLLDISYDDVSFDLTTPPDLVDGFVVDPTFAACLKPGEELLITSDAIAGWDDEHVFTVESVDAVTGHVVVEGTTYHSFATLAGPDDSRYAAEVARLGRDIVFEAQEDDPDELHGGHLIVLHTPDVAQTLAGVEIRNFGQQGNLGRYPIHFHMSGHVLGSVVEKNVVRGSNQRCVVVHGSHDVTVNDNVAYDAAGHCFITEDGGETQNTFSRNLGARVRSSDRQIGTASDTFASIFWITHATNHFIDNVAAGCQRSGYWFETLNQVSGPSFDLPENEGLMPRTTSLGTFRGNVAHSNGDHGVRTYSPGWQPADTALFENLHSYKNNLAGLFVHGSGNIDVRNSHFADNRICVESAGPNTRKTRIYDSECVGLSQDVRTRFGDTCRGTGMLYDYDERVTGQMELIDVAFSGFGGQTCAAQAIQIDKQNGQDTQAFMGGVFKATGLTFADSDDVETMPDIKCSLVYLQKYYMGEYVDMADPVDLYVEDFDGNMGPPDKGPGFIVQNTPIMTAFAPPGSCSAMPQEDSCAEFCEGVCLRQVYVRPEGNGDFVKLVVTQDGTGTSYAYDIHPYMDPSYKLGQGTFFAPVLNTGTYSAHFEDGDGNVVHPAFVRTEFMEAPLCANHVTKDSLTFEMAPCDAETGELTLSDGTFDSGFHYGYSSGVGELAVQTEENDGNNYLRHTGRNDGTGLDLTLNPRCLTVGKTYRLSLRYRFVGPLGAPADSFLGAIDVSKADGTRDARHFIWCNNLIQTEGEWSSQCHSRDFYMDPSYLDARSITVGFASSSLPSSYDVDYDDVSFAFVPPDPTAVPTPAPFTAAPSRYVDSDAYIRDVSGCTEGDGTFSSGSTEGFSGGQLGVVEEDGDAILRQTGRAAGTGLNFALDASCLEEGGTYDVSFRFRPHGAAKPEGAKIIGMASWNGGAQHMIFCFQGVQPDTWGTCTGTFAIDNDSKASSSTMNIGLSYWDATMDASDVDYDDVVFKYRPPPTSTPTAAPTYYYETASYKSDTSGLTVGEGTFSSGSADGFSGGQLSVVTDDADSTNKILRQTGRAAGTGLNFAIDASSLEMGSTYDVSFRFKPHGTAVPGEGAQIIGMASWQGGAQHMIFCFQGVQANTWGTCTGTFAIDNDSKASSSTMNIGLNWWASSMDSSDVDYDDFAFKYQPPPTSAPTPSPFEAAEGALEGDGTFTSGSTGGWWGGQLSAVDDGTGSNKILRQTGRAANTGLNFALNTARLVEGKTYDVKFKFRPHGVAKAEGAKIIGMAAWSGGAQHMIFCFQGVQANAWGECAGTFAIDNSSKASSAHMNIHLSWWDGTMDASDVDYDDFSFVEKP